VPLPAEYTDHSSQGFAFREDQITNGADLVIRFGRAMAESTVACNANVEGCVKSVLEEKSDSEADRRIGRSKTASGLVRGTYANGPAVMVSGWRASTDRPIFR
jgi:hypothetical protein